MAARQENLRPAGFAPHVVDIGADAVAGAEALSRDHLVAAHHAFCLAEIDHHRAELHPLDDAVHDLADAILVFLVLALTLGVAHLLHDYLLGGLRGDAREIDRRQGLGDDVAHLRRGIAGARILQTDLGLVVLHQLDDVQIARHMGLARLLVDIDADLVLAAVAGLGGALHRLFHGVDDDRFLDRLVARDRVGDLQELEPVCGNSSGGHSRSPRTKCCHCLRAFKSSAMSLSVSTSLASAMLRKGNFSRSPSTSIATSLPSSPISIPLKRRRPLASGAISSSLASWPAQRAKSVSRVSGRSMPGEDTSSRYSPSNGSSRSRKSDSARDSLAQSSTFMLPSGRSAMICKVLVFPPRMRRRTSL